jgi:hypothetical protein
MERIGFLLLEVRLVCACTRDRAMIQVKERQIVRLAGLHHAVKR